MSVLPHSVTLPVLGIPTRFESNAPDVIEIVEEAFGIWRALGEFEENTAEPLRVRIALVEGDEGPLAPGDHASVCHECPDAIRVVVRSAGSLGVSDPSRREAVAQVSAALLADRMHFRTEMLETLTLSLLSAFDRHPVHAAAVAHEGHVLLLAAPSGTGKSTLAYACHAAGLDLMAEDHVRVQLEPALRIWGWPTRVRLLEADAERLGAPSARAQAHEGREKVVVDTAVGMSTARLVATRATVCILARDGAPLAVEPLAPADVQRALEAQLAPGFDRFPARWPEVARAITARGGWRLNLTSDAREALPVVRDLLARAGRHA